MAGVQDNVELEPAKEVAKDTRGEFKSKRGGGNYRGGNRPFPYRGRGGGKPGGSRHGGAKIGVSTMPKSLSISVDRQFFPIYTSNFGCAILAQYVYSYLNSMASRFLVTLPQLTYITQLVWLDRIVRVAIHTGQVDLPGNALLKRVGDTTVLPAPIADYIESMGTYEVLAGHTFSVLFKGMEWFDRRAARGYFDPIVPPVAQEQPLEWPIDYATIEYYNVHISRGEKRGMPFRLVDNSNYEGKPMFIVSREVTTIASDIFVGRSPQVMTESEATLGAVYNFRDYSRFRNWPDTDDQYRYLLRPTFTSSTFSPSQLITSMISTTANASTETKF